MSDEKQNEIRCAWCGRVEGDAGGEGKVGNPYLPVSGGRWVCSSRCEGLLVLRDAETPRTATKPIDNDRCPICGGEMAPAPGGTT